MYLVEINCTETCDANYSSVNCSKDKTFVNLLVNKGGLKE